MACLISASSRCVLRTRNDSLSMSKEPSLSKSMSRSPLVVDEKILFDTRLEIVREHLDNMAPPAGMKKAPIVGRKPSSLFRKIEWDNIIEDCSQAL